MVLARRRSPRLTLPTQLVLGLLLEDPLRERYGLEIGELTGLASGTVHPILARLEGYRWVESRWEQIDPRSEGRPARRFYRLTDDGAAAAAEGLAAAHHKRSGRRSVHDLVSES